MNRTKSSIRNMSMTMTAAVVTMLLQLVNRKVFVNFLSSEYLGLNGLFSDVLSMLSLSELGVGAAMVYALYKPVATKDIEKIKSLMRLYKRLYTVIGIFILCVGVGVTPFLKVFIKEMPDIPYIHVFYVMYVLDVGLSYLYTYKRSLIICNREDYISTITTMCSTIGIRFVQLIVLILTHNYFLYLLVQVAFNRVENIVISRIAVKKYPYLSEKEIKPLERETTEGIKKNVLAMMAHKVGGVVVNGTDNIIISKILGLKSLGVYSNYNLLISTVSGMISRLFSSVVSNIGNLVAEKEKSEVQRVFNNIFFMNFWLYSVCTVCFFCLLQPFIRLWLGVDYLLSDVSVWILALGCYFYGMRCTIIVFREATGVFLYDKYKSLIEAVLNIVVSIPLTIWMGVGGVKLGSIISLLLTSFWIESYVFFKNFLNMSVKGYLLKQVLYAGITISMCFGINYICLLVDKENLLSFVAECIVCFVLPNIILLVLFYRTKEFKYFINLLKGMLKKRKKVACAKGS